MIAQAGAWRPLQIHKILAMGEGVFLGQLEAFLEIARLGNVTRAADSLFLTQPALTSRLKRLEQEIGVTLVIRDRHGARLPDAGRAFLPYAERAVATMNEAQRTVTDLARGLSGDLAVAATSTFATYILPPVVRSFTKENPSVRLSIHSGLSEAVLEMVLRGEAHLGLARSLQHPEVQTVPLYEEEYVLLVDRRHPLAKDAVISSSDLAGETLITLFRNPSYREFVQRILARGTPPRNIIDLDNPETGKRMVTESLGIGLFPRTAVADEMEKGTMHRVTIDGLPPMRRTMAAMRLRGASELSIVRQFLELVTKRVKEMALVTRPGKGAPRAAAKR